MRAVAMSILTATLALSRPALADDPTDARASLLTEARAFYAAHDYVHACQRLAAVNKLQPAAATLVFEAGCYQRLTPPKLATAWRTFRAARLLAGSDDKESVSQAQANEAQLEPMLGRVRLAFTAGDKPTDIQLTVDGDTPENDGPLGVLALDSGRHRMRVDIVGRPSFEAPIDVIDGRTVVVDVPPPQKPAPAPKPAAAPDLATPGLAEAPPNGKPLRIAGLVIAGVGVASLGASLILALSAKSEWNDAKGLGCDGSGRCPTQGAVDATNSASSRAGVATIFAGAGITLGVGGVAMWLLAPSAHAESPSSVSLGFWQREVVVTGRF